MIESIISHIPSWAELISALPVIFSLILIEGLLSVDNAMAIAAMASALPKDQQKKALRYGIIGAYAFRGICLLCVSWIISNPWLKFFGAGYLIYLMCKNLVSDHSKEEGSHKKIAQKGLLATIVSIEIMDLSLSIDNVVAAVALDKRLWVVCLGVFIGILALRFVAGHCIKLIAKFPVLEKTAFLLVGFVGCILLTEMTLEHFGVHVHIDSFEKFIGILLITAGSVWYDATHLGRKVLGPVVRGGMPILRATNTGMKWALMPVTMWFVSSKK